jgi:hypothetical protein
MQVADKTGRDSATRGGGMTRWTYGTARLAGASRSMLFGDIYRISGVRSPTSKNFLALNATSIAFSEITNHLMRRQFGKRALSLHLTIDLCNKMQRAIFTGCA